VTVTLPIHPLRGISLRVVRCVDGPGRERYIDAEDPAGRGLRLPLEWTDRGQPAANLTSAPAARVTAWELLLLVAAVRALLSDDFVGPENSVDGDSTAERMHRSSLDDSRKESPVETRVALDRSRPQASARRAVGNAGAPGGARRKGRGRRCR
jgi:hypothetical protein